MAVSPQSKRREAATKVASMDGVDSAVKIALIEKIMARDSGTALESDRVIYRVVVTVLGAIGLFALLFVVLLVWQGKPVETTIAPDGTRTIGVGSLPDIFLALGSVAVGALAGLLAPSPRQAGAPATTPPPPPPPGGGGGGRAQGAGGADGPGAAAAEPAPNRGGGPAAGGAARPGGEGAPAVVPGAN